jgi:hypothetical protein
MWQILRFIDVRLLHATAANYLRNDSGQKQGVSRQSRKAPKEQQK